MRFYGYFLWCICFACGGEPVLPPPAKVIAPPSVKKEPVPVVVPAVPSMGTVTPWSGGSELHLAVLVPNEQPLAKRLAHEHSVAAKQGRKPYVMVYSDACPPCVSLRNSLNTSQMKEAFRGVHLILLDNEIWETHLDALGMKSGSFPRIHELTDNGQASPRVITGEAWDEDIPKNMAPPLQHFLRQ